MLSGAVTVIGIGLSILLWFLKNRGKTKSEINKDAIEYERKKRQRDIDNWWLRRN
jgi:hypothetical protein